MQVTIHAGQQKEPFKVDGKLLKVEVEERSFVTLNIRQPGESINDGVCFILESPGKLRDLIMSLVDVCERLQAEEIAEQDARLKAKVHAVLDAHVALRARATTKVPYESPFSEREPAPAPSNEGFFADGAVRDDEEVPF